MERSSSDADVLVVGGGPGGSAAAITCANAGLRVTLLERARFPRPAPGETLHPGVEPIFTRLGVSDAVLRASFLRHEGQWVTWDRPRTFQRFGEDGNGPWRGFQAWRATLDAILLDHARSVGAAILQPCTVHGPVLERSRLVGLVTSEGTVRAPVTIDASGSAQWLARRLGLPTDRLSRQLVAWYGYAAGASRRDSNAPELVADASGWTWMSPVRRGVHHWTRLSLDDWRPSADWLPMGLRGTRVLLAAKGANVTWRIVRPCAGRGFFLVGDAAGVLEPVSSHGVLRALMSGMMAGRSAMAVLEGRQTTASVTRRYHLWLSTWFRYDIVRLREAYAQVALAVTGAMTQGV